MPQIAQQDYKIIAPKPGRAVKADAAASGELKKALLNGIAFDCLLKDPIDPNTGLTRVEYIAGDYVAFIDPNADSIDSLNLRYTVPQYQGLAAVQEAIDEKEGIMPQIPVFEVEDNALYENSLGYWICVDGKYLTVTGSETIEALTIAENGHTERMLNITWEDAQKLIGLPISS